MIASLFGSLLKEKILVYLAVNPESYPNEIARNFMTSLSSVQNHLEHLENDGIVCSRLKGKTRLYDIDPRCPFKKELTALFDKLYLFMDQSEKDKYYIKRIRPGKIEKRW